jgi:hypothetical protein
MQAPATLPLSAHTATVTPPGRPRPGVGRDARSPERIAHPSIRETVWVLQGRKDHPAQSAGTPLYGLSLALPCPPSRPPRRHVESSPARRAGDGLSFFQRTPPTAGRG